MSFSPRVSDEGLVLSPSVNALTYAYGLSDFWASMFEDPERVESILEANTFLCADVYSKFLQLSSTLSLDDIQSSLGYQCKLVFISDTDYLPRHDRPNTYKLDSKILSTEHIYNRPFLPTRALDKVQDFHIDIDEGVISFANDIFTSGFPARLLPDGSTQIAMWFIDCKIDEALVADFFARHIGIEPARASDAYKSFVYGMYFLFTQGPNIDILRSGLNLVLGIPLSREEEIVLDTYKDTVTDSWIVLTDENQYILPYGLTPAVSAGDQLRRMQELADWVEVSDYKNKDEWWINLLIPEDILPYIPAAAVGIEHNRYATPGSYAYEVMSKYLKHNTFLVKINVDSFRTSESFTSIAEILKQIKPAHTYPIYVWSVSKQEEELYPDDDSFEYSLTAGVVDIPILFTDRFRRNAPTPLSRDTSLFFRNSVPSEVAFELGISSSIKDKVSCYAAADGTHSYAVTGFLNKSSVLRPDDDVLNAWAAVLLTRDHESLRISRNKVLYPVSAETSGVVTQYTAPESYRRIPLYITSKDGIKAKLSQAGLPFQDKSWDFRLFSPSFSLYGPVNTSLVNEGMNTYYLESMLAVFDIMFKPREGELISSIIPTSNEHSYKPFCPAKSDLNKQDYLHIIKITDDTYGVYWMTTNQNVSLQAFMEVDHSESLTATLESDFHTRGVAAIARTNNYFSRGDDFSSAVIGSRDNTSPVSIEVVL